MTLSTLIATPAWRTAFPGAIAATMAVHGVTNPPLSPALETAKRVFETELRARWAGSTRAEIRADPVLAVYDRYYKRFGQSYHVQMQIESVALKGKPIPTRAALVEAMFMAELGSGVLTAVHDIDQLSGGVTVDLATGDEAYVRYDGVEEHCKSGDMYMCCEGGVLTSVIQGPTTLALVTAETTRALFCVYAPAGVDESLVRSHLDTLAEYVRTISPNARVAAPAVATG